MAEPMRSTGTVKWFSAQKGFGFIAPDDEAADDLFVHQTSIRSDGFRTLSEGQPVEFSVDFADDGRSKAVDVVPIPRSRGGGGGGARGGRGFYGARGRGTSRGGGGYGRGRSGGYIAGGGGSGAGACYNCGRFGHLARDCYQGGGGGGGGRRYGGGGGGGGGGYSGGGGSGRGGRCYNCGDEGHFARDCPNGDGK